MIAAGAILSTVLALASPQSQPAPQRPPRPGTGLIVGRVVDGTSGRPIPGAIVTLGGAGTGALGSGQPRAMTNGNGQFVFRKLTPGSYVLTAARAGYVTGAFGSRRPGAMSAQVQLEEGERASDIVIPMWLYATISGTVTDEAGEPAIGVQVRAFYRRIVAGRRRLSSGPSATTDDRGIYRLTSLAPGEYVVAFVWRETSVPAATAEMMRSLGNDPKAQEIMRERFSLGAGGGLGIPGTSSAIQVGSVVRDLPAGSPVPPSPDENSVFIYATQFYPGVPSAARAKEISLASGEQRESIDLSLTPVKTARVSGTLIGPDGPAANMGVRLTSATEEALTELETSVTMTGAGGEFTLTGVPPGQYTIKVLRVPRPTVTTPSTTSMTQIQMGSTMVMTSSGGPVTSSSMPAPVPDDPTMFAEAAVNVGNRDVTDLILTLQRGARVTGRLEFDGTRERPDAAALMRVPVTLDRADAAPPPAFNQTPSGRADDTGAFKTYGVSPGKYFVRIGGAPAGWTLRSVMSEGRDVSETPLDLRTADVANVVITFTDRPTKLTGMARTAAGNADPDALVVVFPTDSSAWSDYGLNPRRVRNVHASKNGSYTLTGLPAGEYDVAAINEETTPQWRDPRGLEELARSATQVRLVEGEARMQDLKTVKGGSQ